MMVVVVVVVMTGRAMAVEATVMLVSLFTDQQGRHRGHGRSGRMQLNEWKESQWDQRQLQQAIRRLMRPVQTVVVSIMAQMVGDK